MVASASEDGRPLLLAAYIHVFLLFLSFVQVQRPGRSLGPRSFWFSHGKKGIRDRVSQQEPWGDEVMR